MTRKSASGRRRLSAKSFVFPIFMIVGTLVAVTLFWAITTRNSAPVSDASPNPELELGDPARAMITLPDKPRLLIIGDSYSAGIGADDPAKQGYAYLIANRLGWETRVDAIGGTGYTWGGGEDGTRPDRFADRVGRLKLDKSFVPNIVIFQGGQSDYRAMDRQLTGIVTTTVDLARGAWPGAQVIIFGPAAPYPLAQQLIGIDKAIRAGGNLASAAIISPANGRWFTPGNSAKYAAPDGFHLNTAGYQYLADRFLEEFAKIGGPPV